VKRYQAIYPWIIIVIGTVLRCWNLTTLQPWYDESFTLLVGNLPLDRLFQAVAGDVHPPAYYLIVWSLLHLPIDQVLLLRGFSVLCGVAGLALTWHLSWDLDVSRSARLAGLALLAIHPVAIYYSQEGRMYTWLILLVLVQCCALPDHPWWLGLATLLALYTHNYGLIYSAVLGLIGLVYYRKKPRVLLRIVLAMGIPLVLFLPWAWVLAHQMQYLGAFGYWLPDISIGSVISIVHRAWMGHFQLFETWQLITLPILVVVLVLTFKATRRFMWLWVFTLGPVVLALVVSTLWKPVLLYRGLLPSLPILCLLAGIAFTQVKSLPGLAGRWLLVVPVGAGLVSQLLAGYVYVVQSKSDVYWPPESSVPGPVIHLEDTSYITRGAMWPKTQSYYLDAGCPEQPGALTDQTRLALGYQFIDRSALPDHYYLAGVVGPLSTKCLEDTFHGLTDASAPVYQYQSEYGVYGIWEVDRGRP
jgi:uncharacterized membrane protein